MCSTVETSALCESVTCARGVMVTMVRNMFCCDTVNIALCDSKCPPSADRHSRTYLAIFVAVACGENRCARFEARPQRSLGEPAARDAQYVQVRRARWPRESSNRQHVTLDESLSSFCNVVELCLLGRRSRRVRRVRGLRETLVVHLHLICRCSSLQQCT